MSRFVGHFPQNRIRIGQTSMLSYMYNYNLNCMLESWKEINNARFNSRQRFRYASFETQSIFTTLWRQKTKTTEKKNHKKSFVCTIKRLYKFIFHSIKLTYCTRFYSDLFVVWTRTSYSSFVLCVCLLNLITQLIFSSVRSVRSLVSTSFDLFAFEIVIVSFCSFCVYVLFLRAIQ